MSSSKLASNLSAVNPEDIAFILRDLADCRQQLARERQQLVKVRGEKKEVEWQLEKATQDSQRWGRMAVRAIHENQILREEQLRDGCPRLRLAMGETVVGSSVGCQRPLRHFL